VEAYEYLAKKESILIKKSHTDEVRENANSVFKAKIEPFDDTHETLKHLQKAGYVLNLLTLGDQKVQQKRIKDANLAQYFQDIHIVPEKSTEALEKLLSNKNEKPESLIMVGDSLKGDIKPALDLGMKAYHMKQENWVFDIADVDFNHKNYTGIQKISDLLNHLA
jgi:putative hydrolase of the HAD superfamily